MLVSKFEDRWSFASFFLLLLFMGLFYQVAWQYPVTDSFPLIERLLDPAYLLNDFYTNTFSEFSPRLITAQAIVWLSNLFSSDYKEIVAYLNILRIWLYGIGLYLFYLSLSDKKTALIAFTFSALSFLSMPFLPAWWPISYDLTSSNIAQLFCVFSWYFAIKGSVKKSFVLLTIAVYIHPVVGIQSLLICILLYISLYGLHKFINIFLTLSIYPYAIVFGAAFLFNYLSYDQILSNAEFVQINGQFRHAHHYIFSHMEIEKWISTLMMIVIAVGITKWFKRKAGIDKVTMPIVCYSGVMILLALIFTNLYPTRLMTSFIPMRSFPILVPIIVLSIAKLAHWELKQANYINFFLLLLPFLPYQHVGLTWYLLPNQHELVLPLLITVIVFCLITGNHYNWINYTIVNNFISSILKTSKVGPLLLPVAFLSILLSFSKFSIDIPTLENSVPIYNWISKNTAKDDVVVSELNAANNQKIRLVSRRAVVVSKDFPFNEAFYTQWYQRYTDLYLNRDKARGRIDSLDADTLNNLLDKYSANILLRTIKLESNTYFELIGETQGENKPVYIYKNTSVVKS